jgi:hypothetical protein
MKYISLANLSFGTDGVILPDKVITVVEGGRDVRKAELTQDDVDGFLELGVLRELEPKEAEALAAAEATEKKAKTDDTAEKSAALARAEAEALAAAEATEKAAAEERRAERTVANQKTAAGVTLPGAKKEA